MCFDVIIQWLLLAFIRLNGSLAIVNFDMTVKRMFGSEAGVTLLQDKFNNMYHLKLCQEIVTFR